MDMKYAYIYIGPDTNQASIVGYIYSSAGGNLCKYTFCRTQLWHFSMDTEGQDDACELKLYLILPIGHVSGKCR